jgi:hypothetical protein
MFDSYRRKHRVTKAVRQRIRGDSDLCKQYRKRRWTRIGITLEKLFVYWFAIPLAVPVFIGVCMLLGVVHFGQQHTASMLVNQSIPVSDPVRVLAMWSLFAFVVTMLTARNIRDYPIDGPRVPYNILGPVTDFQLISPQRNNWLRAALALSITGATVFGLLGLGNHWSWDTWIRVSAMLIATIVTSIAVAEWTAVILTPAKLLRTVLHGFFVAITLLAMVGFMAPRSLSELNDADLLAPVWMIPPAGWLASLSGQFPAHLVRDWLTPSIALITVLGACFWLPRSLVVQDVRMLPNLRVEALRKGWITQWVQPVTGAWSRATLNRRDVLVQRLQLQRLATVVPDGQLRDIRSFGRFIRTVPLASCCLLLYRAMPGIVTVVFTIALYFVNKRISFAVAPWFISFLFIFGSYLPLFRKGGWLHAVLRVGSVSSGQTSVYFLFPISTDTLCIDVFLRHCLRLASAFPGWLVAAIIMHQTDMPSSMIWHGLGIVAVSSFLMPAMACLALLMDGWKATFWSRSWAVLISIAAVVIGFGCGLMGPISNYVRLRPEAAWSYVGATVALIGTLVVFIAHQTHRTDLTVLMRTTEEHGK